MSTLNSYSFKTTPFAHQFNALEAGVDRVAFGYTMEQGTGKTKTTIDDAAINYNRGIIDCLVVIAPNGVHRDWVLKAIPEHLPDYVPRRCAYWAADMRAAQKRAWDAVFKPGQFLRVFTFNIEAMAHKRALAEVLKIVRLTNAMVVVDESHRIKTWDAAVTRGVMKLRNLAMRRRILTGTPIAEGPLDAFPQLMFLDPSILPTQSVVAWRARYAELLNANSSLIQHIAKKNPKLLKADGTVNPERIPAMIARDRDGRPIYKNLDELRALVSSITYRVLKSDCLDLPEKTYVRRSVDMHELQLKAYQRVIHIAENGFEDVDSARKPIARLNVIGYLQRILCGIMPAAVSDSGEDEAIFKDPRDNPRLASLLSNLDDTDESCVIWCRYTYDVLSIKNALGDRAVMYYGDMTNTARDAAVTQFQSGRKQFIVANTEAGGTGLNLFKGTQSHYYSNSFKLLTRLQSEDRNHRIGTVNRVLYTDYEVEGTVDSKIFRAFLDKKDVADAITGDAFKEWIQL